MVQQRQPDAGDGREDLTAAPNGSVSFGGQAPAVTALSAQDVLAGYLHARAAEFLRSLRLHREKGADAADVMEAVRQLHRSARRISGVLHVFRPLTDPERAGPLRTELVWLSEVLAREHACAARLTRLRGALHRLSGAEAPHRGARAACGADAVAVDGAAPARRGTDARPAEDIGYAGAGSPGSGALTVGAARAVALLERQLTQARTRAHSAALQALDSSRFHAVADAVAVLASEAPLDPVAAEGSPRQFLEPHVQEAHRRLVEAVEALPLYRAGHPYNAEALVHGLALTPVAGAPTATERQDAPWHRVRLLLRLRRYAQEVLEAPGSGAPDGAPRVEAGDEPALSVRLYSAAEALDRHRDAAEAAEAAAAAARTPRIAPATAYALGVLHADQRHDVEAARYVFGQLWQRLAVNA